VEAVLRRPQAAPAEPAAAWRVVVNRAVVVGALGYFVDIYDLLLFSIVRVQSLRAIGVADADLLPVGVLLLNAQMIGLLLGGILWGVLGDRRGRVSVLFGSIALYSVANIANAFVTDVETYAVLRFVAGVGLAGELGAAVTLVAETLPANARGYGTAVVGGVGILGAVAAAIVGGAFAWQVAYLVGGGMGLVLLVVRFKLVESGLWRSVERSDARKGDLRLLFGHPERLARYAACVLVGLPIWFVVGVVVTFSPELSTELRVTGPVSAGDAILWCYVGLAVGGFGLGAASQRLRSRWWTVFVALGLTAATVFATLLARGQSPAAFYGLCAAMGLAAGYWTVFITIAAEQFGTNLRATVATTVPNFIRGSVVPITLAFSALAPLLGLWRSAMAVGAACLLVSLVALRSLPETHGKDLDYLET